PAFKELQLSLLNRAIKLYDKLYDATQSDPEIRFERARASYLVADQYRALRKAPQAEDYFQRAINELRELLSASAQDARVRRQLGTAYFRRGLLRWQEDFAGALEAYDRAFQMQQELVQENPEALDSQRDLAITLYNRGILHERIKEYAKAR